MKIVGAFFIFACYLGSIQAATLSCQTLISRIDNVGANMLERVRAASQIMTAKCVGELTDKTSGDSRGEFLKMRTRMTTVHAQLSGIQDKDITPRVKPLLFAVKSYLSLFIRVKSKDRLEYLFDQAKTIESLLKQFGDLETKKDFFTEHFLTKDATRVTKFGVTNSANNSFKMPVDMAENSRSNVERVIETARDGRLAEFTSIGKLTSHQAGNSGVEVLFKGAEELKQQRIDDNDQMDRDNRVLQKDLSKSADTFQVRDPTNNKYVWIPCSSIVALDFKSEEVKAKALSSTCFNEVSNKALDALTPEMVAEIPEKHFTAMNYRTINRLFTKGKLAKISKARFAEIGKTDPLVCTAFTEDRQKEIDSLGNVALSSDCLLAAPGWAHLVAKMGNSTPIDFFEKISPKAIAENLDTMDPNKQINAARWKKVGEDLCTRLRPETIEKYPSLQGSLPASCFDFNPELVMAGGTSAAKTQRDAYLNRLVKSKSAVGVTSEIFAQVAKMKEKDLAELSEEWCALIEGQVEKLDKKLAAPFKCSGFAFKKITDTQLEVLARNSNFCQMMRPDIITAIGSDRFFDKVNNKCVSELNASVLGLMTESVNVEDFPWKSVSEQQLTDLSGAIIVKALSKLPPTLLNSLSESQELAIELDADAKKTFNEIKAKQAAASAGADAGAGATPATTPAATPAATPTVTPAATPTVTPAVTPTVTPAITPVVTKS